MDLIENDYDNNDKLPSYLKGCIFNYLDTESVANYLANRYDLYVIDEIIRKIHIV